MSRSLVFVSVALASTIGSLPAASQQPYAGLETRSIKALSEQQVADLRAGRGMGLALAAELNGYPGPAHVLELAEPLGLSDEQRAKAQALFDAMKSEAVPIGEKLIAQEAELDRQFADKTMTPSRLEASTEAIGNTSAALRRAHLKYHLSTLGLLTPAQVSRYAELRGYNAPKESSTPPMQHRHGTHPPR
jgi:Spy/CpxP family protein refolding chaperone